MTLAVLEKAVSELVKYFNLPERDRLLQSLIIVNNEVEKVDQTISRLVLENIDGSFTTSEIIDKLNDHLNNTELSAKNSVNKIIKIFPSNTKNLNIPGLPVSKMNTIIGATESKNKETKENPTISAICIRHARISVANRETNALTLFFNSIPTIEIARCVPYLDVQVQTSRPSISVDGRINSLSALRFLMGAAKVDEETADFKMLDGISGQERTYSGMELFTMPQTLVDADVLDDVSLRPTPVIDKFRPLASIESFKIKVHPAGGMMSWKTGELNLILHDRSRLWEISELIKPDLFGRTDLLIEYGWSHPDISGQNAYADLLNAIRQREKYNVVNCAYSFDDVGQVKIKLDIAMRGASDFFTSTISEMDDGVAEAQKVIQEIIGTISELKESVLTSGGGKLSREVRELVKLDTPTDLASAPAIKNIRNKLRKLKYRIRKTKTNKTLPAINELVEEFDKLYGDGKGKNAELGAVGSAHRKIADGFQKKMNLIADVKTIKNRTQKLVSTKSGVKLKRFTRTSTKVKLNGSDPFLDLDKTKDELENLVGKNVSLGKLFLIFIGQPLLSSGKFDDIQFLFYNFNSNAGKAKDRNIAEFQINVADFKEKIRKVLYKRQSVDIPLWEFMEFITNQYVDDFSNENYGMTKEVQTAIDPETGKNKKRKAVKKFEKGKAVFYTREELMDGLKLRDGIFKMPFLSTHVETFPGKSLLETDDPLEKNEKSILKLHIFDRQNSSYETQQSLLRASRDLMVETIGKDLTDKDDKNKHGEVFKEHIQKAVEMGILEPLDKETDKGEQESVYRIKGGTKALKNWLYETTPYIRYGSQGGVLLNAGFSTLYDEKLNAINLMRNGRAGNLLPDGVEKGNLPLLMFPAQLSMKSLGCPLLQFGQQFFVDFDTGTSCDNLYNVGELSHEISVGSFITNAVLFPVDAYGQYRSLISNVGTGLRELANSE